MDLNVEFADGNIKKLAVSRNCSLDDAIKAIAQRSGCSSVGAKLTEFSLAWKDENSDDWVDVSWLLPDVPLRNQGVGGPNMLLFRKKYFVKNEDIDAVDTNTVLLTNIYYQLHHAFLAGLYKCTIFQAVQLAAVVVCAEFSGVELRASTLRKTGRLKKILPDGFQATDGIEQNVMKAVQQLGKLSESAAQKQFIQRIRKLETFGQSFFAVTFPDEENMGCEVSLLGIGAEYIHWIDGGTMESLIQWDIAEVCYYGDKDNIFSLQFAEGSGISVSSDNAHQITLYPQGIKKLSDAAPSHQQFASPLAYRKRLSSATSFPDQGSRSVTSPEQLSDSISPENRPPVVQAGSTATMISPELSPTAIAVTPEPPQEEVASKSLAQVTSKSEVTSTTQDDRNDDIYAQADNLGVVVTKVPVKGSSRSTMPPRKDNFQGGLVKRRGAKKRQESFIWEEEGNPRSVPISRKKVTIKEKEAHSEDELLAPSRMNRKTKLASRKLRALSMKVTSTTQRLEDLQGVLEDDLRTSSWCDEGNPIYDRAVAFEVQNFIDNSEVTYESLSAIKNRANKETEGVAGDHTTGVNIYGDLDKNEEFTEAKGSHASAGDDVYQDPEEAIAGNPLSPSVTVGNSNGGGFDDEFGGDIYQDPSTIPTVPSRSFDEGFGEMDEVYQDPTTVASTSNPMAAGQFGEDELYQDPGAVATTRPGADQFGEDDVYEELMVIEATAGSGGGDYEEVSYEPLSSVQTAVQRSAAGRGGADKQTKGDTTSGTFRSVTSSVAKQHGKVSRQMSPSMGKRPYTPGSTISRQKSVPTSDEPAEPSKRQPSKKHNAMKDYSTLLRDYRVFCVKLPTLEVHLELVNVNQDVSKLIQRLCVIIGAGDPDHYNLFVEGACLSAIKEVAEDLVRAAEGSAVFTSTSGMIGLMNKAGTKTASTLNYFDTFLLKSFAMLPDQGSEPLLLDPRKSLKEQNISSSRILSFRLKLAYEEDLPDKLIRVPAHIKFHQCWIGVVQGNQPVAMDDAIRLAALQYQAYFLDRTELNSVVGFCRPSEFLPLEYASIRTISDKVFKEQLSLTGYTRKLAQEVYYHTCATLPTSNSVFFPAKEPSKKRMKLTPVYVGVSKEGVSRVDVKTKEVLDSWEYRVLKNWAYTENTFMLAFESKTYPVQTNQGKWIKELIDFHVKGILKRRVAMSRPVGQGIVHRPVQPRQQPPAKDNKINIATPIAFEEDDIYDIPADLVP